MTNQTDSPENSAPPLGLTWGIKRSFVRYLSFLPDASMSIENGAEATNGSFFTFEPNGAELDPQTGEGTLRFKGEVRMSGHGGMMRLQLLDPWITLGPEGATLLVSTPGTTGIAVVTFKLPQLEDSAAGFLWQDVPTFLTADGAALFNGQYPVGQEMDPLFIRLPASAAS
jgi:hypothetical protein